MISSRRKVWFGAEGLLDSRHSKSVNLWSSTPDTQPKRNSRDELDRFNTASRRALQSLRDPARSSSAALRSLQRTRIQIDHLACVTATRQYTCTRKMDPSIMTRQPLVGVMPDTPGLQPARSGDASIKISRALAQLRSFETDLNKYIYLASLRKRDPNLFYALTHQNLTEILPLIYTPTVGEGDIPSSLQALAHLHAQHV